MDRQRWLHYLLVGNTYVPLYTFTIGNRPAHMHVVNKSFVITGKAYHKQSHLVDSTLCGTQLTTKHITGDWTFRQQFMQASFIHRHIVEITTNKSPKEHIPVSYQHSFQSYCKMLWYSQITILWYNWIRFLPRDAMLSAVYAVVVCLCVCVYVTLRYCIKTAKRRITHIMPHDRPLILVFWHKSSWRNSYRINPYGSDKCRWGGLKLVTFDDVL